MIVSILRWLGRNLSTLITAFILAIVVWVSAVIATDPNQELVYPSAIPIDMIGLDPSLLRVGDIQTEVNVTLNAPRSVWTQLTSDDKAIQAWIDLSNLGSGNHTVPVQVKTDRKPVRIIQINPKEIRLTLEPLITKVYSVTLIIKGEPALGYEAGLATSQPSQVTVSGAESRVSLVKEVHTELNIAETSKTITTILPLTAVGANGAIVDGVTITPDSTTIKQPINLLYGYRNVIVKVITKGQVANGYTLTNIQVTPNNVIVTSSDPQRLNELPGYVETMPLDLTGLQNYVESLLDLELPEGISVVNDQKVLVQVSVAPIESNLTLSLPIEMIGLKPGLEVVIAPLTVDVYLSGPVPILSTLKPSDLRVVVDLAGKDPGIYTIIPTVDFLPAGIKITSFMPAAIDVTITLAPTPTPTPTPDFTPTPTPTATPVP